jgi:hypothetical protein
VVHSFNYRSRKPKFSTIQDDKIEEIKDDFFDTIYKPKRIETKNYMRLLIDNSSNDSKESPSDFLKRDIIVSTKWEEIEREEQKREVQRV